MTPIVIVMALAAVFALIFPSLLNAVLGASRRVEVANAVPNPRIAKEEKRDQEISQVTESLGVIAEEFKKKNQREERVQSKERTGLNDPITEFVVSGFPPHHGGAFGLRTINPRGGLKSEIWPLGPVFPTDQDEKKNK